MRLLIQHDLDKPLQLPLSYHQILQGVIYHNLVHSHGYGKFLHDSGYQRNERQYRMFTFSLLDGKYRIQNKQITFYENISFQVSSPDVYLLHILGEAFTQRGITYGEQHYSDVTVSAADLTVEQKKIYIRMLSPICVYSTNPQTRKTHFYAPDENAFAYAVEQNFRRKYEAFYGVTPTGTVGISPLQVDSRDKYVTKYKNFMISGWKGAYVLRGERKNLDFLLQTGIGSKNAQGFGMFEEIGKENDCWTIL